MRPNLLMSTYLLVFSGKESETICTFSWVVGTALNLNKQILFLWLSEYLFSAKSYPEDNHTYSITYEYLYGDDLLISPVYLENVTTWPVYLPRDAEASWVFLWNSSHTSPGGETLVVPSPLGMPPVFYRNISHYTPVFRQIEKMAPLPDNVTSVDG